MSWWQKLDARFFAPAPAERLGTVRFLTGVFAVVYFIVRAPVLADFRGTPGRFKAVGLAAWLDAPLPTWLAFALYLLSVVAGVAFTLGLRYRIAGPAFALLALWVTSYRNSWGMVFHNENLLVLHVLVLGLCDAGAALSLDARGQPPVAPHARYGWPLRVLAATTALAYLLAGIAKLKVTGISWMDGEVLRNYVAYDAMRKKQIGSFASPIAGFIVQVGWPYVVLSLLTLALELFGFLALWNRRATLVWVLGVWGFHVGVFASMAIAFPYPLSGVAFAALFECEKLWQLRRLAPVQRWLSGAAGLRSTGT